MRKGSFQSKKPQSFHLSALLTHYHPSGLKLWSTPPPCSPGLRYFRSHHLLPRMRSGRLTHFSAPLLFLPLHVLQPSPTLETDKAEAAPGRRPPELDCSGGALGPCRPAGPRAHRPRGGAGEASPAEVLWGLGRERL